ncbi:hypothetical protein F511_07724 [Dorcoceras hygrometricum]|uniref:VQ domain-containing protein n=1 Tax=Dorcoceras hygrometricum TaxID=472368 RepID=A0A2Z7CJM6_9LAMI|nr:hypothetical protein F511_07724 [Dorcoceras hygrometricum]
MKRQKKSSKEKEGKDSLKVVYISSPMKVKTSASRFMSLVQQLTGKNSDITQYMEPKDGKLSRTFIELDLNDRALVTQEETIDHHRYLSSISNSNDTTTSCNSTSSFFHDGLTTSQMEEQFAGIFASTSFRDSSLVDVLGSYHDM